MLYLANKLGLRVLAVHVDSGWNSEMAVSNIEKMCQKLDVRLHTYVMDWPTMKELQRAYLLSGVANLDVPQDHLFCAAIYRRVNAALRRQMNAYARDLAFEQAQKVKEKILRLENYQARSTVAGTSVNDVDVFSIVSDSQDAYVNYLRVVRGAVIQSYTMEIDKRMDEPDEELLSLAIVEIRRMFASNAREILLPFPLDISLGACRPNRTNGNWWSSPKRTPGWRAWNG